MLKQEAPDRFRVDFARVRRRGRWWQVFEPKGAPVVDAWGIGQAAVAVLAACPFKSAAGQPQVWNELRVFLSRDDHDRLRPIEGSLHADLAPMLYEELVRMSAVTVGAVTVRLLVDDADEVEPGTAVVHARHTPDTDSRAPGQGEITVRLDKPATPAASPSPAGTLPVGSVLLRAPGGDLVLRAGTRYVLGRSHADAAPDHLALPGASGRINRRQLSVRVDGDHAEISREPGESNPVVVNGSALAPGEVTRTKLPVELHLSGGELRVLLARP
jgi:hypothetical protein